MPEEGAMDTLLAAVEAAAANRTDHTATRTVRPASAPVSPPTSAPAFASASAPVSAPASTPASVPASAPARSRSPTFASGSVPKSSPNSSPNSSPTSAPNSSPTSSPTTSPTYAPTSLPTSALASAPTTTPTSAPAPVPQPSVCIPISLLRPQLPPSNRLAPLKSIPRPPSALPSDDPPRSAAKTSTKLVQLPSTTSIGLPPRTSISQPNVAPRLLPPPPPPPPPLPSFAPRTPRTPKTPGARQSKVTVHEASPPPPPFTDKRKGARIFSPEEKRVLEANYNRNKFPARLHMQTLARAMGKGTEKIRTWYNNRRALDRKLGNDVARNDQDGNPVAVNDYSAIASQTAPEEEPVILPSRVIASSVAVVPPPKALDDGSPSVAKAENAFPGPVSSVEAINEAGLVNVTPSAIAWAPTASPVTDRRIEYASVNPADTTDQSHRFRMSPLRIRNGRLIIGQTEICGELGENPAADQGLEVKFLFGKRRVVYEWYCGENYADSQTTGGPYAKMEMNFDGVQSMQLFKNATRSVLQLGFQEKPILFLQTKESMVKYKARSQQRQYRKVGPQGFPISVNTDFHRIWMRTDEAVRIAHILVEDNPRLAALFQTWNQDQGFERRTSYGPPPYTPQGIRHLDTRACSSGLPALPMTRSAITPPGVPMPRSIPVPEPSRALPQFAASSPVYHTGELLSPAPLARERDRRYHYTPSHEVPIIRPTTAAGAAANLAASPAYWHSPATPYMLGARARRDDPGVHWMPTALPPSAGVTPIADRRDFPGTPMRDATAVRRELNFSSAHRAPGDFSTPGSAYRKRKASHIVGDENNIPNPVRRRLSPAQPRIPLQDVQFRLPNAHPPPPPPPPPPPLPPQFKAPEYSGATEPKDKEKRAPPPDKDERLIHRLPR